MTDSDTPITVGRVFVPGGLPTVTYFPRPSLGLETRLADYLDERHKILSLSGPTKSGKTVLLKSGIDNGIWLSGGSIESIDDLWASIVGRLNMPTTFSEGTDLTEGGEHENQIEGGFKPIVSGSHVSRESIGTTRRFANERRIGDREAARNALETLQHTLIIDDFHYIEPEVQLRIVRELKPLIFDGVPVIFASVPHRAYDAVRVEKEMTGRVEQLAIPLWHPGELKEIAEEGFEALNLTDPQNVATQLAAQSFQSPHLMQSFCLTLCKSQGVRQRVATPQALATPEWRLFFSGSASAASKTAFDLLAQGPRQRTDRKKRRRSDGVVTDIYGATLSAIAKTGPRTKIPYDTLRSSMRVILDTEENLPERHEITRVLDEMCKIAREKIEGEPVVDFDAELDILYISDPFFAFFLKWGFIEHPVPN